MMIMKVGALLLLYRTVKTWQNFKAATSFGHSLKESRGKVHWEKREKNLTIKVLTLTICSSMLCQWLQSYRQLPFSLNSYLKSWASDVTKILIDINNKDLESDIMVKTEKSDKDSIQPLEFLLLPVLRPKRWSCPYESSDWIFRLHLFLQTLKLPPSLQTVKGDCSFISWLPRLKLSHRSYINYNTSQ